MDNRFSSPNAITLSLLQEPQTVFKVPDIAMLTGLTDAVAIAQRMGYAVRKGLMLSPRKGVYAKPGYSVNELACRLYTPSYLSLETVLQRHGVIFQYDSTVTMVGYLNRVVETEGRRITYRKIKNDILMNPAGISRGIINEATAERAFLDMLYLNGNCYFDNPAALNRDEVCRLLAIYDSPVLSKRALNIIDNA